MKERSTGGTAKWVKDLQKETDLPEEHNVEADHSDEEDTEEYGMK